MERGMRRPEQQRGKKVQLATSTGQSLQRLRQLLLRVAKNRKKQELPNKTAQVSVLARWLDC